MFVRSLAALCAMSLGAAPSLTTIQDVLYRADGTRFNGLVTVSWPSFEAADASNVPAQSLTVRIVDGSLKLRLVPNAGGVPATVYRVKYNSDGKVHFEENWSVPSSVRALRVREVRVAGSSSIGGSSDPIQESDVAGLVSDLEARPTKGAGFAAGRAAVINADGQLEGAPGNAGDCLRADGSATPCGGSNATFVDLETPAGLVDGANLVFGLSASPAPVSSLLLYRNGILQKPGQDYVLDAQALIFVPAAAPQPGDTLLASYRVAGPAVSPLAASPELLCAGSGASTSQTDFSTVGICSVAAGTLQPGDRVEVRFDFAHTGAATGYDFEVLWQGTPLVQRGTGGTDPLVSGRADAVIHVAGTQWNVLSWGVQLPFSAGAGNTAAVPGTIDFRARLAQAGTDSVTLRNYTVIRYPAQ